MRGITVTLYEKTQTGTDPFGVPVWEELPVEIPNVLVAPVSAGGEEIQDTTNLEGRRAEYTLAVPKGDAHAWEGCRVRFWGQTWRVTGKPTEGIDALIPLCWNKKVQVESIVSETQSGP